MINSTIRQTSRPRLAAMVLLTFFLQAGVQAQEDAARQKKWSVSWGWNRAAFSNSDIHFWGSNHDFTLKGVQAADRPGEVSLTSFFDTYVNPMNMTLPQTNLRVGYQYSSDIAIALNLDHMKYVMAQDQIAPISGAILGVIQSGTKVLADNWLTYEHTDGLNIISLEIEKQRPVDWFGGDRRAKLFALAGLGVVIPKSNVKMGLIDQARNDEFHLAGYSLHAGAGLEIDLYKELFLRTTYKLGYVNLPDVLTSARGDKAAQSFMYNELMAVLGWRF